MCKEVFTRKSTGNGYLKSRKIVETRKLVSSLNRGNKWSITQLAQNIFFHTEHYFRRQTSKFDFLKIDIVVITERLVQS